MELDDRLRELIGRRCLARENEVSCGTASWRIAAHPVVEHDHAQRIQQLPLVLVDALDLTVKH